MCERLAQGQFADFLVRAIRLPVMCDISLFPVLPKILDADIGARAVREDRSEDAVRAVSDADERPKNVE